MNEYLLCEESIMLSKKVAKSVYGRFYGAQNYFTFCILQDSIDDAGEGKYTLHRIEVSLNNIIKGLKNVRVATPLTRDC